MARVALRLSILLCGLHGASLWTPAAAQVLGVFRWQMQPYCNLVTFTVIQLGPTYQLTGNDNLCGAPTAAPATGTATPNPNGTISLGFDIVTPSGAAAHVSATIDLSSVSGTWTDADGNTGPFVFNGPGGSSPLRPAPTRSTLITSTQLAASIFAGTGVATTIARSDHVHDGRYFTEAETTALVADARVITLDAGSGPATITPQATLGLVTFNTPRAGRILITYPANFNALSCTVGTFAYVMLVLDGSPLANSVQTTSVTETYVGTLSGLVTTSVPAGSHTVGVGVRCASGTFGSLVLNVPKVHVVVFP